MKKRIIILIFIVIFISGCQATVNIKINKDSISESIDINHSINNKTNKDVIINYYRNYVPVDNSIVVPDLEPDVFQDGIKYYKYSFFENNNMLTFNYSNEATYEEYKKSRSVKSSFKDFNIIKNDSKKTLTIKTDNYGHMLIREYPSLENVIINITSEYPIIENNADSCVENICTWNYNQKNFKKSIFLVLQTGKVPKVKKSKKENKSNLWALALVPVIIIGFLGIVVVINKIFKKY